MRNFIKLTDDYDHYPIYARADQIVSVQRENNIDGESTLVNLRGGHGLSVEEEPLYILKAIEDCLYNYDGSRKE